MAFKKKIKAEVAEEVIDAIVAEEVKVEEKKVIEIPKSRPAIGRFFMEVFGDKVGIYNQKGILVGKEKNADKAKDMVNRFNYLSGKK